MASSAGLWRSLRAIGVCGSALVAGYAVTKQQSGDAFWKAVSHVSCSTKFGDMPKVDQVADWNDTGSAGTGFEWDFNWDKRQQNSAKDDTVDKASRTLKHFIFVRHGDYNTNGSTDEEKKLSTLGREQAMLTGKWLARLDLNYTKIVQSTMTRAKETCEIISRGLPHVKVFTTDLLREGAPIPPVPRNRANEPELKYHSDGPRIEAAFRKYVHRPGLSELSEPVEIYVCHANVIRYFICRVAQFPPEGWLRMSLRHGSITWVTVYSDGDVVVRCIGDTGYMPPSKLSR